MLLQKCCHEKIFIEEFLIAFIPLKTKLSICDFREAQYGSLVFLAVDKLFVLSVTYYFKYGKSINVLYIHNYLTSLENPVQRLLKQIISYSSSPSNDWLLTPRK